MEDSLKGIFTKRLTNIMFYNSESLVEIMKRAIKAYENPHKIFSNGDIILNQTSLQNLSSGGYGYIFKINEEYCVKVNTTNSEHEWLIPNILGRIDDKYSGVENFVNLPVTYYPDCFHFGIYQTYIINALIVETIKTYLTKKNKTEKNDTKEIHKILLDISNNKITQDWINIFTGSHAHRMENNRKYNKLFNYIFKGVDYPVYLAHAFRSYTNLLFKKKKILDVSSLNNNNTIYRLDSHLKELALEGPSPALKKRILSINPALKDFFGNVVIQNLASGNFYDTNILNGEIINYPDESAVEGRNVDNYVKLFLLEVLIAIYSYNKRFSFIHNDLKPDNVLVFHDPDPKVIHINNGTILSKIKFIILEPYVFRVNDFDFSSVEGVNNSVIAKSILTKNDNIFADIHFLFLSLFMSPSYRKQHPIIYSEFANLVIPKCTQCKSAYDKEERFDVHYVDTIKITHSEVENFLARSPLFKKWRKRITDGSDRRIKREIR